MNSFVNFKNTRSKNQVLRMEKSFKNKMCIFCKEGLKKIHKLPILKVNDSFSVTNNAFPYEGARKQILIIPKRHISNVTELSKKEWEDLKNIIDWVIKKEKIKGGGLFLRFGDNKYNGGTLEHLHFQIIVGDSDDTEKEEKREKLKVTLGWKKK